MRKFAASLRRVEPRGFSRTEAADYVGVGASLFHPMVPTVRCRSICLHIATALRSCSYISSE